MPVKAWTKKKDLGENEVMKCPHREPATPVRNALRQNASSRARSTLTPSDCEAISLSRDALMERPKDDLPIRQTT